MGVGAEEGASTAKRCGSFWNEDKVLFLLSGDYIMH